MILRNCSFLLSTFFVEFQKAYNSIWRDGPKDKLKKVGINEKFLNITHAMYKTPYISLFYKNKVTKPFYTTTELKQGDILKVH